MKRNDSQTNERLGQYPEPEPERDGSSGMAPARHTYYMKPVHPPIPKPRQTERPKITPSKQGGKRSSSRLVCSTLSTPSTGAPLFAVIGGRVARGPGLGGATPKRGEIAGAPLGRAGPPSPFFAQSMSTDEQIAARGEPFTAMLPFACGPKEAAGFSNRKFPNLEVFVCRRLFGS